MTVSRCAAIVALGLCASDMARAEPTRPAQPTRLAQVTVDTPRPSGIDVRQHPPEVTVEQPAPTVDVRQPTPSVHIERLEPRVDVRRTPATVEIVTPPPSVEVRQAPPKVSVEQRPPRVEVRHAAPQVRVEREQADVKVTTEPPRVVIEHSEPTIVITREAPAMLPFSAVVGRTLLSDEGRRIGVIEAVRIETRTDRLYAIVMNSAGVKHAVPYPVLARAGRYITAPRSISRRYSADNFKPVPADRVVTE